jgi:uncharacterized membrane protein HdeD (DUF308 family)
VRVNFELERDSMSDAARAWWLVVVVGVASLVAGVILVTKPSDSLATLAVIVGIFLLIDGIVELFASFGHPPEGRAIAVIVGLLGVIIGILLVRHPTHAVTAIGLLIGIWLVAAGVLRLLRAIAFGGPILLQAVIALIEVVVGLVIVSDPHIGYATLAVLTGIWLIVNGIGMIALGLAVRKESAAAR